MGTKAKSMVGGGPLNEDVSKNYGADGYGKDAAAAVRIARSLTGAQTKQHQR